MLSLRQQHEASLLELSAHREYVCSRVPRVAVSSLPRLKRPPFFLTQTRFSLQKKKFALLPVQEQRDKNEMCTMELHSQEGVKKISDENYVGFCAFSFNNETS